MQDKNRGGGERKVEATTGRGKLTWKARDGLESATGGRAGGNEGL